MSEAGICSSGMVTKRENDIRKFKTFHEVDTKKVPEFRELIYEDKLK